jgi:carbon storage regulator CsrA
MLVLSGRVHEKIHFPGFHTTIQVVSIHSGMVRLGVEAPEEARALRQELPDRVAEWGLSPEVPAPAAVPVRLGQLVEKRLAVSQRGLSELRQLLRSGNVEDARGLLDKVEEDLHLLRRRMRNEAEAAVPEPRQEQERAEYGCLSGRRRPR